MKLSQSDSYSDPDGSGGAARTAMAISASLWVTPAAPAAALLVNGSLLIGFIGSAVFAGLAQAARLLPPKDRPMLLAVALMGHCITFTAAFAGHRWQVDSHMLFFAMLAIVATMGSMRALVMAVVITSVHHLLLSLVVPVLIYPAANVTEALERTVLHAAILVFEALVLLGVMRRNAQVEEEARASRVGLAESLAAADELRRKAEDATAVAEALTKRVQLESETSATIFDNLLTRFASGDLTARVNEEVPDGYRRIKHGLNSGLEQVRASFAAIRAEVEQVRAGASEIAGASEDLSRRTENQAANLEETAAAVEEITATVRAAAESSTHVREIVAATKADAERSGQVVGQAVEAMGAIESSSRKITNIIGVIDEIAFQTNLLALNAGVEAARAGDAGRGFAVVATEVRALAQRSAQAAQQIKELISTAGGEVAQGVEFVGQAGDSLKRIIAAVAEINDLVTGIAAGAVEQSTGLGQVSTAVGQLDQITQSNAAMVEQTTAAVRALAARIEGVKEQVARFTVGDPEATPEAARWEEDARRDRPHTTSATTSKRSRVA